MITTASCLSQLIAVMIAAFFSFHSAAQHSMAWEENFDTREVGEFLPESENWTGFQGFRGGTKPVVAVVAGKGIDGSKALSISSGEDFRADNFGLQVKLNQAYEDGVVWIQCRYQTSSQPKAMFFLDACGEQRRQIVGRVAAGLFDNPVTKRTELRWHSTWSVPHWRLYTLSELDHKHWYTVTLRIDLDAGMMAAWVDDQPLAEAAPLCSSATISQLYLSFGGSPDDPALVDDLSVSRNAPEGFEDPKLLPDPEDGLVFRFAGIGDPQLGFGGYEADKIRFGLAVDQINESGAELSVILGDMVHFNDKVEAYEDLAKLAEGFKSPHCYVRGNHERLDLFQQHFNREINYSTVHKGVRFVVVDAIGNQAGLSKEQLQWIEAEFSAAGENNEEIVLSLHVSPWQNNRKGAGKYNQIGAGRDQLRALMNKHKVLLCLSGHYHTGLWHGLEEETHYLVLGGTALVKGGTYAWCLFDVYPDRIVVHQKPLFFGYEKPGVTQVHALNNWIPYEILKKSNPNVQQGPLTISRHRPTR